MVNTYLLVNPHIEGDFKTKIKARNSVEAGHIFYKNLSEHFNNSVPKFYFSIQKGSSSNGKYYNFEVKESRKENDVSYKVKQLQNEINQEAMQNFKNRLETFKAKFNQDGGKKSKKHRKSHDDDSSDSSEWDDSSEEFYKRARTYAPTSNYPIYYYWYDPYIYNLNSIYIPTFYSYITPYIELSLRF